MTSTQQKRPRAKASAALVARVKKSMPNQAPVTAAAQLAAGNRDDLDYHKFLQSLQARANANILLHGPNLFATDASPKHLWEDYRGSFPTRAERQHHNCAACRHFIQRYGGLVVITTQGQAVPLLWDEDDTTFYPKMREAVQRLQHRVSNAQVKGLWLPEPPIQISLQGDYIFGEPETPPWRHMHMVIPAHSWLKVPNDTQTAHQYMAERKQDFENLTRAAREFTDTVLQLALKWLSMPASPFSGADQYVAPLRFLIEIRNVLVRNGYAKLDNMRNQHNAIWKLIAMVPPSFCHPKSGMLGLLLAWIQQHQYHGGRYGRADSAMQQAVEEWNYARDPAKYMRPTAPAKAGNIDQAEKLIEQLGLRTALNRRIADHSDIPHSAYLWRASRASSARGAQQSGVFSHLKLSQSRTPFAQDRPVSLTWAKFCREILPELTQILYVPNFTVQNHIVLTGPVDPNAPRLFKWDNPFAWYLYEKGSLPARFGLTSGKAVVVPGIITRPEEWGTGNVSSAIVLLGGADEQKPPGLALFPQLLRSELHSVRSTLEAHSRTVRIRAINNGQPQAIGVLVADGEIGSPLNLRVTDALGSERHIIIDRWD